MPFLIREHQKQLHRKPVHGFWIWRLCIGTPETVYGDVVRGLILFIYMLDADWNPEPGFTSIDPIAADVEIRPVNLAVIGYGLMIIVTIAAAHIVRKWIGPSADIAIAEAATNRLNSMFIKFVEVRGRQCFVDWLPVEFRHAQAALADDLAARSDPEPPHNGSGVVLLAAAVIAAMLDPSLTVACAVLVAAWGINLPARLTGVGRRQAQAAWQQFDARFESLAAGDEPEPVLVAQ